MLPSGSNVRSDQQEEDYPTPPRQSTSFRRTLVYDAKKRLPGHGLSNHPKSRGASIHARRTRRSLCNRRRELLAERYRNFERECTLRDEVNTARQLTKKIKSRSEKKHSGGGGKSCNFIMSCPTFDRARNSKRSMNLRASRRACNICGRR